MTFDLTTKITGLFPNGRVTVQVIATNLYTERRRGVFGFADCMTGE